MEVSESMLVYSILDLIGVNSLWLGGLHIRLPLDKYRSNYNCQRHNVVINNNFSAQSHSIRFNNKRLN